MCITSHIASSPLHHEWKKMGFMQNPRIELRYRVYLVDLLFSVLIFLLGIQTMQIQDI